MNGILLISKGLFMTNGIVNGKKIKPKVTAIIQARMQSKRLPGKAMLELAGRPLLSHVIERTKLIEGVDTVVVATSMGNENYPIIELAESMDVNIFVGSMDNVLERYYLAANEFGGEIIIRVTGDNPFTDVDYASMILDISIESGSDLCALANLPLGTAVEVIKRSALEESYTLSEKSYHLEHVTPFIKEHPELFSIERPEVDIDNPFEKLRLTVDTDDDYRFAAILYENLYNEHHFTLSDVIEFLKENPELVLINNEIKQRPAVHSERI